MNGIPGDPKGQQRPVAGSPIVADEKVDFRFRSGRGNFREAAAAALAREMRWRWLKFALACLGFIVGGWYFGKELIDFAVFEAQSNEMMGATAFVVPAIAVLVVASAIPFVPGAEIGLGLMLVLGAKIALVVYASMVSALTVSFLVGRLVPPVRIADLFGYLGLERARGLVLRLTQLDPQARLALLSTNVPRKWGPFLLRHRYAVLIVLLNIPGNSAIGGGGGIAFTAGMSGLFSLPAFFAALLIAVAPVPIMVIASGYLA